VKKRCLNRFGDGLSIFFLRIHRGQTFDVSGVLFSRRDYLAPSTSL